MTNISQGMAIPPALGNRAFKPKREAPNPHRCALAEQKRIQDGRNKAAVRRARIRAIGGH